MAILSHVDLVTTRPRDATQADIAALRGAGVTEPDIVRLSQVVAFVNYQVRVIAGLQTPSAGDVQVLGRDVGRMPARARSLLRHHKIGFLGQSASSVVSPDLSVADAVGLPLALRGIARPRRRADLHEHADRRR